jgi:hypothetical protein
MNMDVSGGLAPYRRSGKTLITVGISAEQRANIEAEASRRGVNLTAFVTEAIEAALEAPDPSNLQRRGQRRFGRDFSGQFALSARNELMERVDAAVARRGGTRASFVEDATNAALARARETPLRQDQETEDGRSAA